jgi:hypothetical protein
VVRRKREQTTVSRSNPTKQTIDRILRHTTNTTPLHSTPLHHTSWPGLQHICIYNRFDRRESQDQLTYAQLQSICSTHQAQPSNASLLPSIPPAARPPSTLDRHPKSQSQSIMIPPSKEEHAGAESPSTSTSKSTSTGAGTGTGTEQQLIPPCGAPVSLYHVPGAPVNYLPPPPPPLHPKPSLKISTAHVYGCTSTMYLSPALDLTRPASASVLARIVPHADDEDGCSFNLHGQPASPPACQPSPGHERPRSFDLLHIHQPVRLTQHVQSSSAFSRPFIVHRPSTPPPPPPPPLYSSTIVVLTFEEAPST